METQTQGYRAGVVVAVLGLGAMGSRMAQRLRAGGWSVVVWNRTPARAAPLREAGARWADTPREAAAQADVVLSMLSDREAALQVWLHPETGAAAGLRAGTLAVEASTLTPETIHTLAEAVQARGAVLVDAPVVGSRPQAEAGALISLASGPDDALDRLTPILSAYSSRVQRCGPRGNGTTLKLMVNAWFAIQVAALGEVLGLAQQQGVAPDQAAALLRDLPVTSPALAGLSHLLLARQFAPLFPIDLVEKDLRYAASLADRTPMTDAARRLYQQAQQAGLGHHNLHAVAQLFLSA